MYVAPDNRPDTIDCGDGEDTVVGTYDATDFFVDCEIDPMPYRRPGSGAGQLA
ncbi:MAG: hypothetical protein WKF83_11780 [Nocardioidaceae bacterium]